MPRLADPDVRLPKGYESVIASGPLSQGAEGMEWRVYFQDPALKRLIALALDNSRDLRASVLRVQEARAVYGIQRSEQLPTLALAATAMRSEVPGDLNLTRRPVLGNQFNLGAGFASWEIDFWGRAASLSENALNNYLATESGARALEVAVIAQVAQAYLSMREMDERLALARQAQVSRAETLRIFRRRTELGATSRLDLSQVELLWQQASALVAQLEQVRAQQWHVLMLLLGTTIDELKVEGTLEQLTLAPELSAGLPSTLLAQRPDIRASELALKAAQANVAAARAAFFPRIVLTSQAGSASAQLDGLFETGSRAWTFAPSLSLPIFDNGRLRSAFDLSVVRREQAVVRYEQTIQSAFRDVADALAARHWLAVQADSLRATQALQHERSRLAQLRYESGAARYLEVLDAERDRLSIEQQGVQLRRIQLSSQVALWAALGGGAAQSITESMTGNVR